jgi:hypothetical protein
MAIAMIATSWVTWLLLALLALVLGFFLLLFTVALVEKLPLASFGGEAVPVDPGQFPPYLNAMNEAAARHGFAYGGTFRHVKGGTYRVLASFWFSPDRRTVLQVTAGTIAKMSSRTSVMTSVDPDGRLLVTRDEMTVTDLSGIADVAFVINADFAELWSAHSARLHQQGDRVRAFEQATPREAHLDADLQRVTVMVNHGLARWTDRSQTVFRYTLAGAVRIVTTQFFGQLVKHRSQSDRFSRPRPGDVTAPPGFPVMPVPAAPNRQPASPPTSTHPFGSSDRDFLH